MRVLAASVCVVESECGDEADLCALYVCDGYAADKVCVECDTGYFVAVAIEGVWVALSRIGVWLGFGIGFGLGELGDRRSGWVGLGGKDMDVDVERESTGGHGMD